MSNELKLPWTGEVLSHKSELSLETAMGFGCSPIWVIVPSNHYVPIGTPCVVWDLGEDGSFVEMTAQRSYAPLWSSVRALDDHPERIIFVPKEYWKDCRFYPLPDLEVGLLCTVVLTDGTEGVVVKGDHFWFLPYTTTSDYAEGTLTPFATPEHLVAFFQAQVVKYRCSNIYSYVNPAFRGDHS